MNNFIEKIPEVGMQLKNVPKNKILEVSKDKNFFVFGQNSTKITRGFANLVTNKNSKFYGKYVVINFGKKIEIVF